jgi:colanic acid biosynthesis glycosyl transferase WcaI
LGRVLHLLSFAITAAPLQLWWSVTWRPQVSLVVAPFFTAAPMAWLAARLGGAKTWLHVQDFEVDVAFRIGLLKGGLLKRAVSALERFVFRRFDRVSSISQRMLERAGAKGVAADRLVLVRNWVDVHAVQPLSCQSPYRRELGLPDDAVVVLFSGTLGGKQGLQLVPQAARLLDDASHIHFILCGDGPVKADLQQQCEGLAQVHFLPLQPLQRLGDLLGLADIHLLTQDAAAEDLVLPSKLSGMLASGLPVVATCRMNTEIASVVAGSGRVVAPDDPSALAQVLRTLASDKPGRSRLGAAARVYARQRLARDEVLSSFERGLRDVVAVPG